MNFAPDMDVNNNPITRVINYRSFGDNKYNVAAKGSLIMQGMQSGGLVNYGQTFPRPWRYNVDSHQDLPQLPFSRERLDSPKNTPSAKPLKPESAGIMIAHMNIRHSITTPRLPSTLSRPIITGTLKDSLGFKPRGIRCDGNERRNQVFP